MQTKFHVIIVAAGSGSRFGDKTPKQYCMLNGKPVIQYCLDSFLSCAGCAAIYIAINPEHKAMLDDALSALPAYALDKITTVNGGVERYDSVYNALCTMNSIDEDTPVLIHDAARPFIEPQYIESVAKTTASSGAATLAVRVVDTLRYAEKSCVSDNANHPPRADLWSIQTPQGFTYGLIRSAHERAQNDLLGYDKVTDDTGLVQKIGQRVELVSGSRLNFKITQIEDLIMAQQILGQKKITKMATGYDVHAFEEYEVIGNYIKLGGISIPHKYELKGHSDADVALHALTDALYGLIADGDIGAHFPPSDDKHKNQDSADFLIAADNAVKNEGGSINHVDLTIICEKPAIGPQRDKMRENIARIMGLDIKSVSVKATTTEGLGFTGRREGIAVQAAVTADFV
jgi:2-C-methyl-D-erythritol 4-phosphate cytidylyltransferase/2-C-methyl-D-erythritol 2,4-cyclodiphosphate synthase